MSVKGAMKMLTRKLGFRRRYKPAAVELIKVKKYDLLNTTVDETSNPPDSDEGKLLMKIVSLETLRERNGRQLQAIDQEISTMSEQLRAKGGEVVPLLQNQLDQKRQEAEHREKLLQSLSQENEDLKSKMAAVTEMCQIHKKCMQRSVSLETQRERNGRQLQAKDQEISAMSEQLQAKDQEISTMLEQLQAKDQEISTMLEQLQAEDQEISTMSEQLLTKVGEVVPLLQNQLDQNRQEAEHREKLIQSLSQENEDLKSKLAAVTEMCQTHKKCMQVLSGERALVQEELRNALKKNQHWHVYDQQWEAFLQELLTSIAELKQQLNQAKQTLQQHQKDAISEVPRQYKAEAGDVRPEEERKSVERKLLLQVKVLLKGLLAQHNDQKQMAALKQQIHFIQMQQQQQQRETQFSELSSYTRPDLDKTTIRDRILIPMSPVKSSSTLDNRFLVCPTCNALYPVRQYRKLLAHLDYCFN